MTDLYRTIKRKIFVCKNVAFHYNYSTKQGKIYINSPIDNEKVILNDNLRDVLGFKRNVINCRSAGSISGMDRVIFANYPPDFSSNNCIFIYASFVETSRVGKSIVTLLRVLIRKSTLEHIHHYNIKYLQYILVNTWYLGLCQLTLRMYILYLFQ